MGFLRSFTRVAGKPKKRSMNLAKLITDAGRVANTDEREREQRQ